MNFSQTQNQIVFIDSAVVDPATLLAGLAPGMEVVMLQPRSDGLGQIAAALAGRGNLQAIHLISHGSSGEIQLGSTSLSSANLAQYQSALQDIGSHLSASGDILIYGCDVAAGVQGQNLVQQIANITQADMAASSDLTGAAALGGDWVLEYQSGHVDNALPMTAQALADYGHILVDNTAPTITIPSGISFAAKVDYATGTNPKSVTSADVTGDGKADLIVANTNSGTVSVLKSNGDGTFAAKVDNAISIPYSVTSADVNGDGKADLIVGNYSSVVSVLKSNGDGTFATKVDYATGGLRGWSVATTDVNGDGKADLIVANYNGNNVSVLLNKNDGTGTFHTKVDYATGNGPYWVSNADVNADGKADLIVANSTDNTVSLLKNNGNGTFAAKADYATGSNPKSVTSADVNRDGKADLIVANDTSSGTVSVLLGTGTGTFAAKVDYATGSGARSVASADMNNDGWVDLIVTNGNNKVSVLQNNGNGTFAAKLDYTAGSFPDSVTSADVNGDGKMDLVTANLSSNTVSVLLNTSGLLATAFTEQTPVAASSAITLSDANGDADWNGGSLKVQITAHSEAADSLSLATSNPGGSGIWLDTGNKLMAGSTHIGSADAASVASGSAWTFTFNASATNALVQASAQAVQFNNSSDTPGTASRSVTFTATDKNAAAASGVQTISVTTVNDTPTITGVPGTAQAVSVGAAAALDNFTVADVDGDNLTVTLTANNGALNGLTDANTNLAGIQLTGSAATVNTALAAATFTATAAGAASIAISVSDGVVTTPVGATYSLSAAAANVAPTITIPSGISFAAKVDYATGSNPKSVTSADVTGDGKADLIVANTNSDTVSVLKNNGDGTFAAKVDYAISFPRSVTSADVNGDGKADLIVGTYSKIVSVLKNNGDGTFAAKANYDTGGYNDWSVISADVDHLQGVDLIVANASGNNVSVLKNNGNGTFATKVDYATGNGPYWVASADVTGDGKADLIVANSTDNTVSLLKNNGNGTFAAKADYATGSNPKSVTSADVNGDGKADLIVANDTSSGTVSVLLGTGTGTFAAKVDYATGSGARSVARADMNNDGWVDLIVTNSNNKVSVLQNNGNGTFAAKLDYATGNNPDSVTSADVNSDGKMDLMTANTSSNTVSVLLNTSGLLATAFTEQTAVAASSAITLSDANGDADWNGGSLKVQITAHSEAADNLSLATSNPGGSGIWLDTGNKLMAGSTHIGSADAAFVASGSAWTFTFNASATNALVQASAQAVQFNNSSDTPGTASRSVTFTATDKNAAAASGVQTINVTTVNDAPSMAANATVVNLSYTDTIAAETFANATGTLAFADAESNSFALSLSGSSTGGNHTMDSVTYDLSKTSPYGTLYLVSTGANKGKYLFVQDDVAINKLASTTSVDFVVKATDDGSPVAVGQSTIKVTLTGANDTPVLLAPTAIGMVDTAEPDTQDGLLKASSNNTGTLRASDAENGGLTYGIDGGTASGTTVVNGVTYDVSKAGVNGTLYVKSSTGGYVFVPAASAVNALVAGSTSETFTVTASDGSASDSQTLTVSYTGVNDTPAITSSNPPTALHYVDTTASDTFSNQPNPLTALVGTDAEGAVTYGITGGTTGDTIDSITYDVSKAGIYGTLYLKSTGTDAGKYVYVPNAGAINRTPGNATNLADSFDLTITDATTTATTTLVVKVVGADDVPVIDKVSFKLADTAATDTFSNKTGTLNALDVDTDGATSTTLTYGVNSGTAGSTDFDTVTYDVSKAGIYGTLYVKSADGRYVYVPDATAINALNALNANNTDSFTISASDGASTPGIGTNTFTVNINAVNDAPVLAAPTAIALSDTASADSFSNQLGTLSATDAENAALTYTLAGATLGGHDSFDAITYDLSLSGKYGTLYLVSADATHKGKYVYVPDATKINALTSDAVDSFGVGASDGTLTDSSVLAINLTGVNDAPVLGSVTALSYTDTTADDNFETQGGQLDGRDADSNAALTYGISGGTASGNTDMGGVAYDVSKAGTYGALYVSSSSGAYLYVPDKAKMQSLKSGSGADTFTVSLTEGGSSSPVGQTLTVNLTGADDPTTPEEASTGEIAEDATNLTITGQLVNSDRDTDDATNITTQTNTLGIYGSLSMAADGQWSYTLNNSASAVQALSAIASQTDTFSVLANGVSNNVVITVNGANDAPVITGVPGTAQAVTAGTAAALADFTVADVDGDSLTVTLTATNGTLSGLIDANTNTAGIQLSGSAAAINSAIAAATFTAAAAGSSSIAISVSDGVVSAVTGTYTLVATAPAIDPPSPPPPPPTTVDGTTVQTTTNTTTVTNPDGTTSTLTTNTLVVEPVQASRPEDATTPNSQLADIPLVTGSTGGAVLTAGLPVGVGLQVVHTSSAGTGGGSVSGHEGLIQAILARAQAVDHATEGVHMSGFGSVFLQGLPTGTDLLVRTLIPTVATGVTQVGQPIVLQASANLGSQQEALVIDTTRLPIGTTIHLGNVEFAAVIGSVRLTGGAGSQFVIGDSAAQFMVLGEDDDMLFGGGGDDTVGSMGGNDRLFGNAGNDTLFGGAGANFLHGGTDSDVATFSGNIERYDIVRDHGKTTVRSLDVPGDIDTLVNVEVLRFANADYTVKSAQPDIWIASLYDLVLGRQADLGGFQYWTQSHDAGYSIGEIGLSFLHSAEYQKGATAQQFDNLSAGAQLDLFYQHFLGRTPDAPGHAYWMQRIQEGTSLADVAQSFVVSIEMQGIYVQPKVWEFFV